MTKLPETNAIALDLEKGWLTICFNRPENRNALSDELASELRATLGAIRNDRSVRGVTLRGNGGVFCAGGDLKAFQQGLSGEATQESVAEMNRKGGELFELLYSLPQPTLALVDGAAIAGGLGLLCCCDITAVTRDAKFALTETQLGIAPAQITPFVVQRAGLTTAKRLMLTGARFKGEDAAQFGIADFVVDDAGGLDEIETQIREDVLRCAPGANAVTKELILAAPRMSSNEMRAFAAEKFAQCMLSDEGREGIMSFVQKQKPGWAS